jgi:diaminopimelate epimerase
VRFAKYQGTGNDFVLVGDLADEIRLDPALVAAACDRRFGIGADGLIRIAPAAGADFFMDYYNSDGQVAEMCGNGIRCLAKYVYDHGLSSAREIDVATRAGIKHLEIHAENGVVREVTVDMGSPAFERKSIPMSGDPSQRFLEQRLDVDGRTFTASCLSMGNPHCVLFMEELDDLSSLEVSRLGPLVEGLPLFPGRTNVEFVRVVDGLIDVRVWERGSGETMACGTGASAALVACALSGRTGREADIRFPGGLLRVAWREDDHVLLTGPAVCVYEGELDQAWLRRALNGGRG